MPDVLTDTVLAPGDLWFGRGGRVSTLLGSCVSVALLHRSRDLGGMCHFVLPSRSLVPRLTGTDPDHLSGRYGDEAVALLLDHLRRAGTGPEEYEVGIVGGGRQFDGAGAAGDIDVPGRNIVAARALLTSAGLQVVREHVGGRGPRTVVLDLTARTFRVRHTDPGPRSVAP